MTFEIWIAFVLASAIVVLIPGPNIVLTVNFAIRDGKRSGLATVPGVVLGAFVGMSVSLAGAGALLATSALLFTILKLVGAAYLIWLAYTLWHAPVPDYSASDAPPNTRLLKLFVQSFLTSVLNPKGPAFYVAFVPQFVTLNGAIFQQLVILTLTFCAVAALNSLFWLLFADRLRHQFRNPSALRLLNRIGASCLFAAGLLTTRLSRIT